MREHEVPTHVQAEDKVLLWLTFPQVVTLIAVAAAAYGTFSYAPGPTALRIGVAAVIGLVGAAAAVGQINGRRLPIVIADLLKYWLGPRRFAGQVTELMRLAPVLVIEADPGLFERMQEKGRRRFRRLCRRRDRRNGGKPDRNSDEHGKRRPKGVKPPKRDGAAGRTTFSQRKWVVGAAMVALCLVAALPQVAFAQGDRDERGSRISEVGIELPPPVLGRRVFVESITVSDDRARVSVRAAADVSLSTRAYGGDDDETLRFVDRVSLQQGEAETFDVPLNGERPSVTLSWVDSLGQAGGVSLSGEQIPHPLPSMDGGLCDAQLTSLSVSRAGVNGTVSTDCKRRVMETMELRTVTGPDPVEILTVREAEITGITGRLSARLGSEETVVPLVTDGATSFSVAVDPSAGVHDISLSVDIRGALRIPVPPLVTMHTVPERTVRQSHVVSVLRPGISRDVSETVTILCEDGTEERHRISVRLSIPARTIEKATRVPVTYQSYVTAEITERDPAMRWRDERIQMASTAWADAPYMVLALPEPEPTPEVAEQIPASSGVVEDLFERIGWEWPW